VGPAADHACPVRLPPLRHPHRDRRHRVGTAFITDPIEVGAYDHRFAKLEHAAVFGDEARTVFARVADEYRALREPTRGTGGPIRSR